LQASTPPQGDRKGMASRRQDKRPPPLPEGEDKPSPLLWTSLASRFVEQVMRVVRRSSQGDHPTPGDRKGMANRRRDKRPPPLPEGEDKPRPYYGRA
jgi:hypothetical protein